MQFVANHAKAFIGFGATLFAAGGVPEYFGGKILHDYNGTATDSSTSQGLGIGLISLGGACQFVGTAICLGTYYAVHYSAKSGENTVLLGADERKADAAYKDLNPTEEERFQRQEVKESKKAKLTVNTNAAPAVINPLDGVPSETTESESTILSEGYLEQQEGFRLQKITGTPGTPTRSKQTQTIPGAMGSKEDGSD